MRERVRERESERESEIERVDERERDQGSISVSTIDYFIASTAFFLCGFSVNIIPP